jgi:hypothetical protein
MLHTRGRGKGRVEHLILIAPLASPDPVDETVVELRFLQRRRCFQIPLLHQRWRTSGSGATGYGYRTLPWLRKTMGRTPVAHSIRGHIYCAFEVTVGKAYGVGLT